MAIHLDSAKLDEARQAKNLGWVYGVTTNPSPITKAGVNPEVVLRGLAELEFDQVYYQLVSRGLESMLLEALEATELVKNGLILKIVPTQEGFRFVAKYGNDFPCCATAIFDPAQVLVAREVGARYIAVYVNRATKQLDDGFAVARELARILAGSRTEILAASLKSTTEAVDSLVAGAQPITVPFDLPVSLTNHPLSVQTVEQFNAEGVGIRSKT